MSGGIDDLRGIVDVAVDVLRDYGDTGQNTRIERMARWILLNLDRTDINEQHLGAVSKLTMLDGSKVLRAGSVIDVQPHKLVPFTAVDARALAVALLIVAEKAADD